jgi:hypothetical protein
VENHTAIAEEKAVTRPENLDLGVVDSMDVVDQSGLNADYEMALALQEEEDYGDLGGDLAGNRRNIRAPTVPVPSIGQWLSPSKSQNNNNNNRNNNNNSFASSVYSNNDWRNKTIVLDSDSEDNDGNNATLSFGSATPSAFNPTQTATKAQQPHVISLDDFEEDNAPQIQPQSNEKRKRVTTNQEKLNNLLDLERWEMTEVLAKVKQKEREGASDAFEGAQKPLADVTTKKKNGYWMKDNVILLDSDSEEGPSFVRSSRSAAVKDGDLMIMNKPVRKKQIPDSEANNNSKSKAKRKRGDDKKKNASGTRKMKSARTQKSPSEKKIVKIKSPSGNESPSYCGSLGSDELSYTDDGEGGEIKKAKKVRLSLSLSFFFIVLTLLSFSFSYFPFLLFIYLI